MILHFREVVFVGDEHLSDCFVVAKALSPVFTSELETRITKNKPHEEVGTNTKKRH